jgi:hypothetical protein
LNCSYICLYFFGGGFVVELLLVEFVDCVLVLMDCGFNLPIPASESLVDPSLDSTIFIDVVPLAFLSLLVILNPTL